MKRIKILKLLGVGIVISALILSNGLVYAAPKEKEDKENNGQGNQGQARGRSESAPGQSQADNAQTASHASNSELRRHTVERGRDQAILRANRPEKTNQAIGRNHEKGTGVKRALEKARWSYNPKDERGQGNMGKVDMRDPYGFDKDSGREGSERGRPIRETALNLAEILSIDFNVIDYLFRWYQDMLTFYQNLLQRYPQNTYYAWMISVYTNLINNYTPRYTYDRIATNLANNTIGYTLTLNPPDGFAGTTLLVTTTLTSINNYSYGYYEWVYNPITRTYEKRYTTVRYDAGQAVMQQTQEVVLGTNDTYSFIYNPPTELAYYSGFYANLSVTVTEPESGTSYTMDYDRQIYLYRCPYGKVTDVKTGQSVVGAKVSVHFEDGSLAALDKASNPTARNPQTTDATGRYGFKLETNRKYYISVTAPGFKDYKSPVFTEKWHVLREDIKLTPIK